MTSSGYVALWSLGIAVLVSAVVVVAMLNFVAGGGPSIGRLNWNGQVEACALALPFVAVSLTVGVRGARVCAWIDGSNICVRGIRRTFRIPVSAVERVEYSPYWTEGRTWHWARVAIVFRGPGGVQQHAVVASTRLHRDARDKAYIVQDWFHAMDLPVPTGLEKHDSFSGRAAWCRPGQVSAKPPSTRPR